MGREGPCLEVGRHQERCVSCPGTILIVVQPADGGAEPPAKPATSRCGGEDHPVRRTRQEGVAAFPVHDFFSRQPLVVTLVGTKVESGVAARY